MINDARLVKMDSEIHKLAVYYVLQKCCSVGLERMIRVWNHCSIPRKWIPNSLALNNGTHPIHNIWNSNCSYSWFWDQHQGGSITDPSEFGEDSSGDNDVLLQHREQFWLTRCGAAVPVIYSELMAGDYQPLQDSIVTFIETTQELSP